MMREKKTYRFAIIV